jgi:hypothetical protein
MTSLEELDRPLPIQDMITQVIRTIRPRKEFLRTPDFGATTASKLQESINRADAALNRPRTTIEGLDSFVTGSSSRPQSAWDAAAASSQNDLSNIILMSGKTQADWQGFTGLSKTEMDGLINQRKNMGDLTAAIDAKYPAAPDAPVTLSTTTTTRTTTTTTTKSTSGNSTADKLMGDTKAGKDDGATVDERAALAKKAAEEINANAATPEGMAAWRKLAKRMKDNPKKTKLLAGGLAALAVIATLTGIALNRYLASDGAEIEFTSIKTRSEGLLDYLVDPTDVDCQWKGRKTGPKALPTVPLSDIRVLESNAVIFHEAQLPKVEEHPDGVSPTGVADPKKEFSVSTETGDSSDIDYKNKGWGVVKTSFGAHFAAVVDETIDDTLSTLNKARKQFFPDFSSILNAILVVIAVIIGVMAIGAIMSGVYSLSKSTSTSNTG